ncbi:MAG: hypothetical protein IT183_08125 [Acidobacteria bacterium]|nr:hypothetical protein [Acidobacteriota bacterium]
MRPIDVSDIALGACNFAIASSQCRGVGLGVNSAASTVEQLVKYLAERNIHIQTNVHPTIQEALSELVIPMARKTIESAEKAVTDAQLPSRFHNKIERVKENLDGDKCDMAVASALLMEVVYDLIAELSEPMFLRVESAKRPLYEQKEPPFGEVVELAFPDSDRDIRAAARCLALGAC